jgi:integrase
MSAVAGLHDRRRQAEAGEWHACGDSPQTLSHAEVRRILDGVRNPIHRGCFSLIYGCGLRISEAADLPITAIDKTNGLLRVVSKGNKERVVPVPPPVHENLRRASDIFAGAGLSTLTIKIPQRRDPSFGRSGRSAR